MKNKTELKIKINKEYTITSQGTEIGRVFSYNLEVIENSNGLLGHFGWGYEVYRPDHTYAGEWILYCEDAAEAWSRLLMAVN